MNRLSLKLAMLMLCMVALSVSGYSQSVIIGGDGSDTNGTGSDPVDDYFTNMRYQTVYLASELSAEGMTAGSTITALGFSVSEDNGPAFPTYTIRLAHTAATNSASHDASPLSTVFGPASYDATATAAGSHDMITFSSGFVWDGSSNILVDICTGESSMVFSSPYGGVRSESLTSGSRFTRADGAGSRCDVSTSTTNSNRPQIRFDYTPGSACTGAPAAGTASGPANVCSGSAAVITATGLTSGSGISYQWEESADGISGWAAVTGGSGATTSTYTTDPLSSTSHFRITTTCATGPDMTSSNVVSITISTGSVDEDFSAGDLTSNCWTVSGSGTELVYDAASGYDIGTGSAKWDFYSASENDDLILTSPLFTALGSDKSVYFDVAGRQYNSNADTIHLEESIDGGATWTTVVSMTNETGDYLNTVGASTTELNTPGAGDWASINFPLSAGVDRIRFNGVSDFGNNVFIDNITIADSPTCADPTDLASSSEVYNGFNVDWTGNNTGSGETYNIYVALDGATPNPTPDATGAALNGANSVAITTYDGGTPLLDDSDYDVYLEEDCSGGAGTDLSTLIGPISVSLPQAPCSGTPNAGTASGPASVCSGNTAELAATGLSTDPGITYQWEESADGVSGWSDVVGGSGATTDTYTTEPLTATSYFRLRTDCTEPSVNYSNVVTVGINAGSLDEDFSGGDLTSNCWTVSGTGTNLIYDASSAFGIGTGSAEFNFYSESGGNTLILTSPMVSPVGSDMILNFDVAGTTYTGGEIDQIVLEESADGVAWTSIVTMTNEVGGLLNTTGGTQSGGYVPATDEWESLNYPLSATTTQVRFNATSDFGNRVYLDNIALTAAPDCPNVTDLDAGSFSTTNVDISWTAASGATNYLWEIQNSGDPQGTVPAVASGSGAATSASAAGTYTGGADYVLYVNSDCAGNLGNYQSYSFTLNIPPSNDDCSGATPLTLGDGACETPSPGDNSNATDSGIDHGCALYSGGDIWYSVIVPASGSVTIQSFDTGSAWSDGGMAVYENACGSLSQIACDDDGGTSSFELVELTDRTPGEVLYIAVWEYGNNAFGAMEICAWEPPAPPANDECEDAIAVTASVWGVPSWQSYTNETATESLSGCVGNADDDMWFSFVAQSANDAVLVRGTGFDGVIEIFDGCGGSQIICTDDNGSGSIERSLPGNLVVGNTYYYRVYHYFSGGGSSDSFETCVKTFEDSELQSNYCGQTYDLSQSIYSERDDLGQLYSNPNVPVKGYRFLFEEQGGGLTVAYASATETPYVTLSSVPGLEYGKTYDVSVSHKVRLTANGSVSEFWSQYGTPCAITIQATVPTTQLTSQFCPSATDLYLEQQISAVPVPGASQYRFRFDGPGGPFIEQSNNYTVFLHNVGPNNGPGLQYNSSVYSVTVQAFVNGTWSDPDAACIISMASQPENTELRASYCGGTYEEGASNFILAEYVYGATGYEWEFTPMSGQLAGTQTQITSGISLSFHLAPSLDLSEGGDWSVRVRALAEGNNGSFSNACTISINSSGSIAPPQDGSASKALDLNSLNTEIYPNPSEGGQVFIQVDGLSAEHGAMMIEVVDFTGKVILTDRMSYKGAEARFLMDLPTDLAEGLYFVNLQIDGIRTTEKLLIK